LVEFSSSEYRTDTKLSRLRQLAFCKKQQMQWSKEGAHLLLQTRVRTLNGELAGIFKRWYPDLDIKGGELPIAA
jgi:hypothetical protein